MWHHPRIGIGIICFLAIAASTLAIDLPPSVMLTSPADGATWDNVSLEVRASAADPDGGIVSVRFLINDSPYAVSYEPLQGTLGTYVGYLSPRPAPGTRTLKARAYDNAGNFTDSDPRTIQVIQGPLPTVVTGSAMADSISALLEGTVNANNTYVGTNDYYFEVGLTDQYGSVALRAGTPYDIRGNTPTQVFGSISGLERNMTYHYRLVAKNVNGIAYGEDATFSTRTNIPPTADDAYGNVIGTGPVPIYCFMWDSDGDPLTITNVSTPAHGTVVIGGQLPGVDFTYTPDGTFDGHDEFSYTVSDGFGGTVTAKVRLGNLRQEATGRYVTTIVDNVNHTVGEIGLNVLPTGRFTGVMNLFNQRLPIRGECSLDGHTSLEVDRVGQPPITINLSLNGYLDGIRLAGNVHIETDSYDVQPDTALFFPDDAPEKGAYTVSLPPSDPGVPQGNGYVTGRVLKRGQVVFTGKIGDGQAFSFGTQLRHDSSARFFVKAGEAPRDALNGQLHFPAAEANECTGQLVWYKAPRTTGFYQAGFTTTIQVSGSRFDAGPIDETLLQYTGAIAELGIVFSDPSDNDLFAASLAGPTERSLSYVQNTALRATAAVRKPPVKLKVNRKRGIFTGTVRLPSEPTRAVKFNGVLLQQQNKGAGLVQLGKQTGAVTLAPK